MKPPRFAYADPTTTAEVLDLLSEWGDDAALLAGGQSLLPLLNLRLARPGIVIDLGRVAELRSVEDRGRSIECGAGAGVTQLAAVHPATGVRDAIGWIGHPQIRSRTTVGGTIAHADPAAELPAVLVGLGGRITLRSSSGERSLEAADFFDGSFSTARRDDEMVTAVSFPVLDGPCWWGEVARRRGDFALVGMFVGRHDDSWRVVCSGVGSVPFRAAGCEAALAHGDVEAAVAALASELDPPDDLHGGSAHRRSIAVALLREAVAVVLPIEVAA